MKKEMCCHCGHVHNDDETEQHFKKYGHVIYKGIGGQTPTAKEMEWIGQCE